MPDKSGEPAVGDVVAVEGGAPINQSYTMSDSEDVEDGEASGGTAAASDSVPAAAAEPAAAAQAAAGTERCRLDLCAMHYNKKHCNAKTV